MNHAPHIFPQLRRELDTRRLFPPCSASVNLASVHGLHLLRIASERTSKRLGDRIERGRVKIVPLDLVLADSGLVYSETRAWARRKLFLTLFAAVSFARATVRSYRDDSLTALSSLQVMQRSEKCSPAADGEHRDWRGQKCPTESALMHLRRSTAAILGLADPLADVTKGAQRFTSFFISTTYLDQITIVSECSTCCAACKLRERFKVNSVTQSVRLKSRFEGSRDWTHPLDPGGGPTPNSDPLSGFCQVEAPNKTASGQGSGSGLLPK